MRRSGHKEGAAEAAPIPQEPTVSVTTTTLSKPNPDPRTDSYVGLVVSNGFMLNLRPKFVELVGPNGKLVIFAEDKNNIHLTYVSPFGGEPDIQLFEGCKMADEEVSEEHGDPTDAVSDTRYVWVGGEPAEM